MLFNFNKLHLGIGLTVAAVGIIVFAYFQGKWSEREDWELKMTEAQLVIKELEARAPIINEVVITQYVDRVRYIDRVRIQERVIREFIPAEVDQDCIINRGFVTLHNAAAVPIEPPKLTEQDLKPSEVQLSEVMRVVAENYTKYHKTAAQLESLQNWIREQQTLWNTYGQDIDN